MREHKLITKEEAIKEGQNSQLTTKVQRLVENGRYREAAKLIVTARFTPPNIEDLITNLETSLREAYEPLPSNI